MVEIKGYRVKSSSPKSYVQVTWSDEDRTVISNAWSDTIKGPLLTKAEAYRVAAHWLECGYIAKIVKVTSRDPNWACGQNI